MGAPSIAPAKVVAPVVASEVVQKPVKVEPAAPTLARSLRAEVEKKEVNESDVSDLVKQERMQGKREVEELKKKVAEVKKRRSESKELVEKKKKRKESGEEESMDEVEKLRLQALKTLRTRTESGRSRSPSQNKKAADAPTLESPSDSPSLRKKSSKVSKELDEERKRVENQVKESLLKLNKDSEDTINLLTNLDSAKKRKKKEESDSDSDESEEEKKKKRGREASDDDSDSEVEKKRKAGKRVKKEESE